MDKNTNTEIRTRKPTANKVLPKAGVNGFDWAFVQSSTAVILLNFCAKTPLHFAKPQTVMCHFIGEFQTVQSSNNI